MFIKANFKIAWTRKHLIQDSQAFWIWNRLKQVRTTLIQGYFHIILFRCQKFRKIPFFSLSEKGSALLQLPRRKRGRCFRPLYTCTLQWATSACLYHCAQLNGGRSVQYHNGPFIAHCWSSHFWFQMTNFQQLHRIVLFWYWEVQNGSFLPDHFPVLTN